MQNPINLAISFGLLITAVGSSFAYVYYTTPDLGFDGLLLSPSAARALGMDQDAGVLVTRVEPGGPADVAGLKGGTSAVTIGDRTIMVGGDVVTAIDGAPINSVRDFEAAIDKKSVGDSVRLTVVRDGSTQELSIVLGTQS